MRILIYGAGKTGTTAVYYAYLDALPGLKGVFEPAELSKVEISAHPDLLVKSLAVMKHAQDAPLIGLFDKKVLIIRHPFDRLVSYVLYAPNNGRGFFDDRNMESYLALLRRKLASPETVPFREIYERVVTYQRDETTPQVPNPHAPMKALEAVAAAHPDFHLLRYEDFVDGKLDALNQYNGFKISSDPKITGINQKVARSKDYGDWHKWFLPQDVEFFSEVYASYLRRFGYDTTLHPVEPLDEATTVAYSIKVGNQGRRVRWLPEFSPGEVRMQEEGLIYQQAKRFLKHRRFLQARQAIDRAIGVNPNIAGFYFLRSQASFKQGDYAASVEALRRALAIIPDEPRFQRALDISLRRSAGEAKAPARRDRAHAL